MTHAHFQCSAGVAGDMLLGALVDAGADRMAIAAAWAALDVDGYVVLFERTQRCGVGATWANVAVDDHAHTHEHGHRHDDHGHDPQHDHDHGHHEHEHHELGHHAHEHDHHAHEHGTGHPHRTLRAIEALLDGADGLDPWIADHARGVFRSLCEVEGTIHGVAAEDVELHEVGSVDAIVDVVGVIAALHSLGVGSVSASPLAIGHGTVRAAHGILPNPAPAVAALLARHRIPIRGVDTDMELSTPTGVALIGHFAERYGAPPAMVPGAVGYGAGTADPPGRPNVVQVLVGELTASPTARTGQDAVLIEANVDDVTGEVVAHTIAQLLAAGAYDAWSTSITMKKGRPAHMISALADPATAERIGTVLLAETGSLGLRTTPVARAPQRRHEATVTVDGHPIRVKVGDGRVKVEHDDAAAAARATGRPLRDVLHEAEAAAAGDVTAD